MSKWIRRADLKNTGAEGAAVSRTYTPDGALYPRLTLAVAFNHHGAAFVTCDMKHAVDELWSESAVPASLLAELAEVILEAAGAA